MSLDIAAASMVLNQSQLQTQVEFQVLRKAMDVSDIQTQGLIHMMEQSVTPHLGGHMDIRI